MGIQICNCNADPANRMPTLLICASHRILWCLVEESRVPILNGASGSRVAGIVCATAPPGLRNAVQRGYGRWGGCHDWFAFRLSVARVIDSLAVILQKIRLNTLSHRRSMLSLSPVRSRLLWRYQPARLQVCDCPAELLPAKSAL